MYAERHTKRQEIAQQASAYGMNQHCQFFSSPLSYLQSLALHLLLHRDYSKESSGLRNHPTIIITGSHTAGTPPWSVPIAHHPWLEPLERLRLKSSGLCSTGNPGSWSRRNQEAP
jgi:hypothetical protein